MQAASDNPRPEFSYFPGVPAPHSALQPGLRSSDMLRPLVAPSSGGAQIIIPSAHQFLCLSNVAVKGSTDSSLGKCL